MESIKISIIIPVYNAELYLSESLNSVANQSYRNWELIAINDGSTDKSLDILNQEHKKDSRIKIISISNSGVSHARNVGLSAANGDYILFLDADDLLMPKSLQTLAKICTSTDADIISFNYKKYYAQTNIQKLKIDQTSSFSQITVNSFFDKVFNKASTKDYLGGYVWLRIYKKSFLQNFKFDTQLRWYEDEDFLCNLLSKSKNSPIIYHTDARFYLYRKRRSSAINSSRAERLHVLYRVQRGMQRRYNANSHEYKTLNSLRILTLIQSKQLSLANGKNSNYTFFRNCLVRNLNSIPLKNAIPYILGSKIASLYASIRLNSPNKHKTNKFWP